MPHRPPISLAAVGDTGEALLLRSILESLDAEVRMAVIGRPEDLLTMVSQAALDGPLVISAHGFSDGLVMGPYADGVTNVDLIDDCLPWATLADAMPPRSAPALCTACFAGDAVPAALMAQSGPWIAPSGEPEGVSVPLSVHLFFHGILEAGLSPADAAQRANTVMGSSVKLTVTMSGRRLSLP